MTDKTPHSHGSEYLDALYETTQQAQRQTRDAVVRSQDVVVDAVTAWSQAVQKLIPASMPDHGTSRAPKPDELVDSGYKIAEQLLALQHQFARRLLEAVQPGAERVADAGAASADASAEAASDTASEGGAVKETIKKMRRQ